MEVGDGEEEEEEEYKKPENNEHTGWRKRNTQKEKQFGIKGKERV